MATPSNLALPTSLAYPNCDCKRVYRPFSGLVDPQHCPRRLDDPDPFHGAMIWMRCRTGTTEHEVHGGFFNAHSIAPLFRHIWRCSQTQCSLCFVKHSSAIRMYGVAPSILVCRTNSQHQFIRMDAASTQRSCETFGAFPSIRIEVWLQVLREL